MSIDPHSAAASSDELAIDAVVGRSFPTARRGFDPGAVRAFLAQLATELSALRAREAETLSSEAELRSKLVEAEHRAKSSRQFDGDALSAAVGSETGRVLQVAHEAAREVVARAEEIAAARVIAAESEVSELRQSAEVESSGLIERARREAVELVEQARRISSEAIESTTETCRAMVDEARQARWRILSDLAEKRRVMHAQIQQLRAGKDALFDVVETVAQSVDQARATLRGADDYARDVAARTVDEEFALEPELKSMTLSPEDEPVELERVSSTNGVSGDRGHDLDEPSVSLHEESVPEADLGGPNGAEESDDAAAEEIPASSRSPIDQLFARLRASKEDEQLDDETATPRGDAHVVGSTGTSDEKAAEEFEHESSVLTLEKEEEPEVEVESGTAPSEEAELLLARNEALAPITAELSRVLKKELRESQNELLHQLRELPKGESPSNLVERDGTAERIERSVSIVIESAVDAGSRFARERIKPASTRKKSSAQDRQRHRVGEVSSALAVEITSELRRKMEPGLRSGDGDLASTIGAAYREWKGTRIDTLAGDFTNRAFSSAVLDIAKEHKRSVRWVLDDGDHGCPECDDNSLSGPQSAEEPFPTGDVVPPVHPGCRCLLAPVTA